MMSNNKILMSPILCIYITDDREATDLLTSNATNLISTVETVLYTAARAIIKVPHSVLERLQLVSDGK